MKLIKKYMTGLAAAGFAMAIAVPAHALFASHGTQTVTASAGVGGTPTIAINSIAVLNRSNNAAAAGNEIVWTNAAPTPGAGFLVADQYIQIVTDINTTDGGVQIYTNNTAATGASKFTGLVGTYTATPAGLVDNSDGTQKLPTAWRASTFTIAGITPSIPTNTSDPNSYLWFYHEDKVQMAVPSLNASAFGNGDPFITVYASPGTPLYSQANSTTYTTTAVNSGLHFAQGPTQFGGFDSTATTDIYTEADFTGALAGTTYSTTELILEAFSL
jgi:hypothetical protein